MTYPVAQAFDDISHRYDTLVGLSPGYHAQLRSSARAFADRLMSHAEVGGAVVRILDLGCGSGASTRALTRALDRHGPFVVLGVDASAGMVDQAGAKDWPSTVSFVQARAEDLSDLPETREVDGIFAAYLLRNVVEREQLLHDVRAALRPGGTFVVHDYFRPMSSISRAAWSVLAWTIIIPLSAVLTRQPGLFIYLWRSVAQFETVEQIARALVSAGFEDVDIAAVRGWERFVVHTISARRPR
ncbi:MAG: class I SAM-dependent methyltransferase [Dermatophilaceae bacterium]